MTTPGTARVWALDVDGTILTLPVPVESVRSELRQLFAGRGSELSFRPLLPHLAQAVRAAAEHEGPEVSRELEERAYQVLEDAEVAAAPQATTCDGARELLGSLADPVVLVSNSSDRVVQLALRSCDLHIPALRAVVGRRPGLAPKPDPAPLLAALSAVPPPWDEVICVGDRPLDMTMARAAAARLQGQARVVAWGVSAEAAQRDELARAGADRVFVSLRDLPRGDLGGAGRQD